MDKQARILSMALAPKGEPIFSEGVHIVSIEDNAAGEYLKWTNNCEVDHTITFDVSEWPQIRDLINRMAKMVDGGVE